MMNNIIIEGFKCFKDGYKFNLNNITVFTGANGSGKSSVIQALLLLRTAIERNTELKEGHYDCSTWKNSPVPLNNLFELRLGTTSAIFNDSDDFKGDEVKFQFGDDIFTIPFPTDASDKDFVYINKNSSGKSVAGSFLGKKEFYYLNTERVGPRFLLPINFMDFCHCGYRGEYTAQILLETDPKISKVEESRKRERHESENLRIQTDSWLDYICPGTIVIPQYLDTLTSQMRLRNGSSKSDLLATNIGFGISYALPVIVSGLIAKKDSLFIVENPEAHLHPKGQSNIGYFLAKIASAGVNVIIETHSEHVVNGIRRGMVSDLGLRADDVSMYFFNGYHKSTEAITPITVQATGDLSPFPRDYFDQIQQDMSAIFQMQKKMKNG